MRERTGVLLLALSGLGFASLGLPDGVLGVAWPSIRASLAQPLERLGELLVSATVGYALSSFGSGWLLARMRVGTLLALSCGLTALTLLGYAVAPNWVAMVALGLLGGVGAGAIDAGINTYAAIHHSARTLSLLHAAYGLGTAVGPMVMTFYLMDGGWRRGYLAIGAAQLLLALAFTVTRRAWPAATRSGPRPRAAALTSTLRLPAARLGIATFFLYVGLEAAAGAWLYSFLTGAHGIPMAEAGAALSLYWASLMIGRVVFALSPLARAPARTLRHCVALAVLGAGLLVMGSAAAATAAVALLGFASGPIFPALIATTPTRLGEAHAANAVGAQVAAAAIGQSLVPAGVGWFAGAYGLQGIPQALLLVSMLLSASAWLLERTAPLAPVTLPPTAAARSSLGA